MSSNPNPKAVYQKTSDILAVFQNHVDNGCEHCISILKSGLGNVLVGHQQTKKQIIIRTAQQLEKDGYPVNQICDRISKSSKGLGFGDRYVRRCLETYPHRKMRLRWLREQVNNLRSAQQFRDQETVRKKDYKAVTLEDIKFLSPSKAKQVAKHQMQKAEWWQQQAKQNEQQAKGQTPTTTTTPTKQDEDKEKIIEDLRKQINELDTNTFYDQSFVIREGEKYVIELDLPLPDILEQIAAIINQNKRKDYYDKEYLAIPKQFDKLIISLRTAYANVYSLDKRTVELFRFPRCVKTCM